MMKVDAKVVLGLKSSCAVAQGPVDMRHVAFLQPLPLIRSPAQTPSALNNLSIPSLLRGVRLATINIPNRRPIACWIR